MSCITHTTGIATKIQEKFHILGDLKMHPARCIINCINTVAYKVKLCLESYEDDLNKKRDRLRQQLTLEEEQNIRKLIEQAQSGNQLIAQAKDDRLEYLLEKRKRDKAAAPKTYHEYLTDEERKQRDRDLQTIHRYQMLESEARAAREREFDGMWHEASMKQADALRIREEYDAVDRYRRERESKEYSDIMVANKKRAVALEKQKEMEAAKEMERKMKEALEEAEKGELAVLKAKRAATKQMAEDMKREREQVMKEKAEKEMSIQNAFESQKDQWRGPHEAKLACIKGRNYDYLRANQLLERQKEMLRMNEDSDEKVRVQMAEEIRRKEEARRCVYLNWRKNLSESSRAYQRKQISENVSRADEARRARDEGAWTALENAHLCRMDALQAEADHEKAKNFQRELIKQREEDRARDEQMLAELKKMPDGVTLPDRVPETYPRPEDRHPFSRRMRAAWNSVPEPPCQCYKK